MSLTRQDLSAIQKLIETSERRLEAQLTARINDLDDVLSLQTERGLQAVRDQVHAVKLVVDRIERVQQAEIARNNRQDTAITQIRKA
ncbi:MAG TPA: hypothetical protein VHA37_00910 [Candidatus Saccharimonadales bacterium]|nr:hypothetical protein [Candidatus Saccharimonadales bacterium]